MPCLTFFPGSAWLFWVVRGICLLVIIGVVALLLKSRRPSAGGLAILQERLARGEISAEEFEAKKVLLNH